MECFVYVCVCLCASVNQPLFSLLLIGPLQMPIFYCLHDCLWHSLCIFQSLGLSVHFCECVSLFPYRRVWSRFVSLCVSCNLFSIFIYVTLCESLFMYICWMSFLMEVKKVVNTVKKSVSFHSLPTTEEKKGTPVFQELKYQRVLAEGQSSG